MAVYQVVSGPAEILLIIKSGRVRGHLHSVFRNTWNVLLEDDSLLTLATEELDNSSNTLRINGLFNQAPTIPIGTAVYNLDQQLIIGNQVKIQLTQAKEWHPAALYFPKQGEWMHVQENMDKVQSWLLEDAGKGFYLEGKTATGYERATAELLQIETKKLMMLLAAEEFNAASKQVHRVAGLGPGLTPSGDDFLAGLFFMLAGKSCLNAGYTSWMTHALFELKEKTNAISYAALFWATKGVSRERIHLFVQSLLTESDESKLKNQMKAVLKIGSSSGSDILAGILAGVKFIQILGGYQNDNFNQDSSKYVR
ncbi:DUF2877 domain-containing protein [Carnobacterium gallinarum]|uniref:DUF2877 domain-containing protein n=1 Tax=Carnobacterium gallinarum TaxID=2749 RepID=UPI00068C670A|nr:DUF2877 domain-containing protein [Carnobacterium gallinarum]